jgi:hypothetical protein
MPRSHSHADDPDRTLQDDRARLQVDPEDDSPLTRGEGAPLAEDGVLEQPQPELSAPGLLGGAPVPVETHLGGHEAHAMTTKEDKPIND